MKAHHPRNPAASRHPAFTLVELLVTITIIIAIAALSFTGISKMRKSGDRVVAIRNMSQLQLANTSYAAENNGKYVPTDEWNDEGSGYVKWLDNPKFVSFFKSESGVYLSNGRIDTTLPLGMMDPAVVRAKKHLYNEAQASYAYNKTGMTGGWATPGARPSYLVSQVNDPSRSAVFISATDWNTDHPKRFLWTGAAAVEGKTVNGKIAYRHNNKAIVVYYDGHVGEISQADMRRIDDLGGANNIFWKANAQ